MKRRNLNRPNTRRQKSRVERKSKIYRSNRQITAWALLKKKFPVGTVVQNLLTQKIGTILSYPLTDTEGDDNVSEIQVLVTDTENETAIIVQDEFMSWVIISE